MHPSARRYKSHAGTSGSLGSSAVLPLAPAAPALLLLPSSSSTSMKAERFGRSGAEVLLDATVADVACFCSLGLAFDGCSGCLAADAVVSYAGDAGKLPEAGNPGLRSRHSKRQWMHNASWWRSLIGKEMPREVVIIAIRSSA